MTSLRNSLINLSLWWRALGQATAAATCRVAVLIRIKTFWILIQTTILTRAGLFLISCLTSPWLAPALGPLSANEEKLGRGLVLSCLIFITGTGFHARTIIFITRVRSSQEVTARQRPIIIIIHTKKVIDKQKSAEIKIPLNIWSSEMYKGLAIYIWPAGGAGGEQGLGWGAEGSKHDLGLGWADPSSRGGGGTLCLALGCIHNTHLAHSIIKILIREILKQVSSLSWID